MNAPALHNRPCPLCGSSNAVPAVSSARPADDATLAALEPFWFGIEKERQFFTYHRCGECGLLYNRNYFDDAQLAGLYAAMPPNMDVVPVDSIVATQQGYFEEAAQRTALEGDYLEIGPDTGHLAGMAAEQGRFGHFWLFEPNRGVHAALRRAIGNNGSTILTDMDDLSPVPDGSVGLAVMVHVLDHLLDPVTMLSAIRRTLRPGGKLLIVTHDERSALSRVLGPRWPAFCLQHPELYNPVTIRRLLGKAGYDEVEVMRSANHFPVDFLARQALAAAGLRLPRLPLPRRAIRLRLGNMLTLATAPAQAAAATPARAPAANAA